MKRIFIFLILILTVYFSKPIWEKPVSAYIDLSFFEPIDEKVASVVNKDTLDTAFHYIDKGVDKALLYIKTRSFEEEEPVPHVKKPALAKPVHAAIAVHNIELGSTLEQVTAELGEPKSRSKNEYGTNWLTYHDHYQNFVMVSVDSEQKVNALYTNDDLIASDKGIQYGSHKAEVRKAFGEPIKEMRKGLNIYILQESDGYDAFKTGDSYTYVFYDLHEGEKVTAIQLISGTLEKKKQGIYANGDKSLRDGFEQQLFDLTNAARVRHGLNALKWEPEVAGTARKHSIDMAEHEYFSHENLHGKSPFDRMADDGVKFRGAGENLAYGQSSSIFAHEGLMNSAGHRENILLDQYSHLGTGVSFSAELQPYYTENFLLK